MDNKVYEECKNHFDQLIERRLFSYPFYNKTDEELISDAKERPTNEIEFGLFKLERPAIRTQFIYTKNDIVDIKYFPLKSLVNESEEPIEIRLSSFIFSSFFTTTLMDKDEVVKSSFDYEIFETYSSLYTTLERYYGKMVFVTSCWEVRSGFFRLIKCVNIMPTTDDERSLANLIRESFIFERKNFITNIINYPLRYSNVHPKNSDVLKEVFKEYQQKFEDELTQLDKIF